MTYQKKPTDSYMLVTRLFRLFRASDHLTGVMNHTQEIGCDRSLMKEYLDEVWTAIYDDAREFEDTVRKDERVNMAEKLCAYCKDKHILNGNFTVEDFLEATR